MRPLHEKLPRRLRFMWQRFSRGWSDDETWNLDHSLAKIIAPRLRRFRELNNGHPGTMSEEEWEECLDEMVWAFEYIADEGGNYVENTAQLERAERGLQLFAEHFSHLWW